MLSRRRTDDYSGFGGPLVVRFDRTYENLDSELRGHRETLDRFERDAQSLLGMHEHILFRLLQKWPLRRIIMILPAKIRNPILNSQDPIRYLESEARRNLLNWQETLIRLAETWAETATRAEKWTDDFTRAQAEEWDLLQLEEWLQEQEEAFGYRLDPRIKEFIIAEIASISGEDYTERVQASLAYMDDLAKSSHEMRDALQTAGVGDLKAFNLARRQFVGVALFRKPTQVMRQSAHMMTDVNRASINASDLIKASLQQSFTVMDKAIQALDVVNARMVACEESRRILVDGRLRLATQLNIHEGGERVESN